MKKSQVFNYYENSTGLPQGGDTTFVGVLPCGISDLDGLFDALSSTLSLPEYFGANWNALSDCLRDFHWLKEVIIVLVHEEVPRLPGDDLWEYLDILCECIKDWGGSEEHQFRVMFPEHGRQQISDILD
ncbi:MAG TPA: hypothetical protein DCW74_16890 [Alteromonas australica]|uniref:Barstar (barnase inhibitor) domain-containing protein n=1 Tax=Alteromonas australica TaxID=589873 RepID=A0A350P7X9_9ALTE|nr:hypothetical protein [Alteromonas australica]